MKTVKFSILLLASVILVSGCTQPEIENLKLKNEAQRKQIERLESDKAAVELQLSQLQHQLADVNSVSSVNVTSLRQQVVALEDELARKKKLIDSMQQQMLFGVSLPAELNSMLEDFANSESIVTYDSGRGLVKFKSDLLFQRGSDIVAPDAVNVIKSLCGILNSEQGKEFDVIIAGHTDDMRIAKPGTLAKHPTNWHLSVHRAISVMKQMVASQVAENRMSVRGFGEFRPIAENAPNKKGNAQNRRVEIYIVPRGV